MCQHAADFCDFGSNSDGGAADPVDFLDGLNTDSGREGEVLDTMEPIGPARGPPGLLMAQDAAAELGDLVQANQASGALEVALLHPKTKRRSGTTNFGKGRHGSEWERKALMAHYRARKVRKQVNCRELAQTHVMIEALHRAPPRDRRVAMARLTMAAKSRCFRWIIQLVKDKSNVRRTF